MLKHTYCTCITSVAFVFLLTTQLFAPPILDRHSNRAVALGSSKLVDTYILPGIERDVKPPAPLSLEDKREAILEILTVLELPIPPQLEINPPDVRLTPVALRSGNNWWNIKEGSVYCNGSWCRISCSVNRKPYCRFRFEVIPNHLYLIDISITQVVNPNMDSPDWVELEGVVIDRNVYPSDGHLLAGFIADSPEAYLHLQAVIGSTWDIFSCELTKIN